MKHSNDLAKIVVTAAFLAALLSSLAPRSDGQTIRGASATPPQADKQQLLTTYGKVPLSFEANAGQTSNEVKFLSRGGGYTLFLTRHAEAVLVFQKPAIQQGKTERVVAESTPAAVLRMKLAGATVNPEVAGLEELAGRVNYFVGNDARKWRTNVPTYARVNFHGVYPGVDLAYYGNRQQLEYDFIVAPHADPQKIAMRFQGAEAFSVDSNGDLVLTINKKELRFRKPVVYQEIDGRRHEITSTYMLKGKRSVGFEIAAYDPNRPLIIDPTLVYSTYLGGSIYSNGYGVAADSAGNAYVTGETCASDFPTTPSAFQSVSPGSCPAFVTKFNPTGSGLVYSTYLGGSKGSGARANGIALDAAGNAYVAGTTDSPDFPTTSGAFRPVPLCVACDTGFVTKLNPAGSGLVYSTYLGGSIFDLIMDIAIDASGDAYVTGWTESVDFPITPGAAQPVFPGTASFSTSVFMTKLNASGTALLYSTYLGGSQNAFGYAIAVDPSGNAYVTGTAFGDFPVTPFAFQVLSQGGVDAFVAKIDPTGFGSASLVYSTYLGGAANEDARGIAVDATGNAYVMGTTQSDNFPTTSGAFQAVKTSMPTLGSAFVTKMKPDGTGLVYSTFLGGTRYQIGTGIAVDASGGTYVTGTTNSYDFPTTPDAFQPNKGGYGACWWDAFVTAINPQGSALVYSTHIGGGIGGGSCGYGTDRGERIAVDVGGHVYVGGWTESTMFPTTPGAYQTAPVSTDSSGLPNVFVLKFSGFPTQP